MIFPIVENGETVYYETAAPIEQIVKAFEEADTISEMKVGLSAKGYPLWECRSGLALNFDEK